MKVLIVDDQKLARMNIINQLDESFKIIESASYDDALRKLTNHTFDMCYLDLRLDESSELKGLELIPVAVERGVYTVVMTSIDDEVSTEIAYETGCQDVYIKGNEKEFVANTLSRYFLSKDSFTENHLFNEIIKN